MGGGVIIWEAIVWGMVWNRVTVEVWVNKARFKPDLGQILSVNSGS